MVKVFSYVSRALFLSASCKRTDKSGQNAELGASVAEALIVTLLVGLAALTLLPRLSNELEYQTSSAAWTLHQLGGGTTGTTIVSLDYFCEQQSLLLPSQRDPEASQFCRWRDMGAGNSGGDSHGGDGSRSPRPRVPPAPPPS